jgi:hypothetical protein
MVLFSEDARRQAIVGPFVEADFVLVDERMRRRWFERFFVLSYRRRPPPGGCPENNLGDEAGRARVGRGLSASSRLGGGILQP